MAIFRIKRKHVTVETFEIEAVDVESAIAIVEAGDAEPEQSVDFWEGNVDVYADDDSSDDDSSDDDSSDEASAEDDGSPIAD